jgi:hypothetical protein
MVIAWCPKLLPARTKRDTNAASGSLAGFEDSAVWRSKHPQKQSNRPSKSPGGGPESTAYTFLTAFQVPKFTYNNTFLHRIMTR